MDKTLIGLEMIALLLLLLAFGVHIAVALAMTGFIGLGLIRGFEPSLWSAMLTLYHKVANYSLITVPMFILMGLLAAGGGMSDRLYKVANLWVGKLKGGLGMATVLGCTGFGAICGSSLVTASVFAKIAAPQMRTHGYDKKIAYGICAASGMIGMLIPPSVLIVVYAVVSGESVGKLLIGGIGPGVILAVVYCVGLVVMGKIRPNSVGFGSPEVISWRKRLSTLPQLWPIVVTSIVLLGGMFGGVFNATEASAVGAFTMIILLLIIRGNKAWGQINTGFTESATVGAMVFLIMGSASVFSDFLLFSGITPRVASFITGLPLGTIPIILAIIMLYLVLGMFLDSVSMTAITVPILHPAMVNLGVDPVWYAMVCVMAMECGLLTPPVGLNVFAVQAVAQADVSVEDVFAGSAPFFVMSLVSLAVMIAFPVLVTTLPSLMNIG